MISDEVELEQFKRVKLKDVNTQKLSKNLRVTTENDHKIPKNHLFLFNTTTHRD